MMESTASSTEHGKRIEDLLSIVVITYNRAPILQKTLRNLMSSALNHLQITVLNNHSTDHTLEVCSEFSDFPNFKVVTHKFNLGGCVNTMRAYEYADAPYVWVMGDDDIYDFSHIDDLTEALASGIYDVINLGSTNTEPDGHWGGRSGHIKALVKEGYNYFRYASNVSCSIVRTSDVARIALPAYENIVNHYPHMVLLSKLYEDDAMIYLTKHRILTIIPLSNYYSFNNFLDWWVGTGLRFKKRKDRHMFIRAQFVNSRSKFLAGCYFSYLKNRRPKLSTICHLWSAMPLKNKIGSLLIMPYRYFEIQRDRQKLEDKKKAQAQADATTKS